MTTCNAQHIAVNNLRAMHGQHSLIWMHKSRINLDSRIQFVTDFIHWIVKQIKKLLK